MLLSDCSINEPLIVDDGLSQQPVTITTEPPPPPPTTTTTTTAVVVTATQQAASSFYNTNTYDITNRNNSMNNSSNGWNGTTDPTEVSVGISMYLVPPIPLSSITSTGIDNSSSTGGGVGLGFSAISKARYSDFIVHEVALDGRVAILNSLEATIQTAEGSGRNDTTSTTTTTTTKIISKQETAPSIVITKTNTTSTSDTVVVENDDDREDHTNINNNTKKPKLDPNHIDSNNTIDNIVQSTMIAVGDNHTSTINNNATLPPMNSHFEMVPTQTAATQPPPLVVASTTTGAKTAPELNAWMEVRNELFNFFQNRTEEDTRTIEKVVPFLQQQTAEPTIPRSINDNHNDSDEKKKKNNKNEYYYIQLPQVSSKDVRKQLHIWIKERLTSVCTNVCADTIDNGIVRIWHPLFRHKMRNGFDRIDSKKNNNNNKRNHPNNNNNDNPNNNNEISIVQKGGKCIIEFVLYKENIDTGGAIQQLSRKLNYGGGGGGRGGGRGGRPNTNYNSNTIRIGYAGNKDKRGITSQFVTMYGTKHHTVNVDRVRTLCRAFNHPNSKNDGSGGGGGGHTHTFGASVLRVGNFRYVENEIKLGTLQGNRFDVALRNVQITTRTIVAATTPTTATGTTSADSSNSNNNASCDHEQTEEKEKENEEMIRHVLEQSAQSIRQYGFINYFGIQRFGKYHDTHLTGIAILQDNYEQAITIIMQPKIDETNIGVANARKQWQCRFDSIHTNKEDNDSNNNNNNDTIKERKAKLEKQCAIQIVRQFHPQYMISEVAILNSLIRDPLNYQRAFTCITKTLRMIYVHALQSYVWNQMASYRIQMQQQQLDKQNKEQQGQVRQLLEVMPGDLVLVEKPNETTSMATTTAASSSSSSYEQRMDSKVHVVTDGDIVHKRYTIQDIVLPIMGTNTRLPNNTLIQTLYETIVCTTLHIPKNAFEILHKKDRELDCSGDYRKLLCYPSNVQYEIVQYNDERQPLLQTDYMKIQNIPVVISGSDGNGNGGGTGSKQQEHEKTPMTIMDSTATTTTATTDTDTTTNNKNKLTAMIIGFTLPSSSYATIFLRELMKRPTSSEYQKELDLGGS